MWIPRGIHPVVDFGIERHTLVTGELTQIFHQSLAAVTQVAAARAHLFRVRVQLLRRLSELTRPIQGFSSDPVERMAWRIYFLVSRQIPTKKSSWAHYSAIEGARVGEDAFRIPERSSDHI
jgi:hypothetical protein